MLLAAVPTWIWATLLMTLFVAVSAGTMWLARYALRQPPGEDGDNARGEDASDE